MRSNRNQKRRRINMTNRRTLLKYLSLVPALFVIPNFIACSFSSVYAEIKAYVPVGLQAFTSILSILASVGIIPPGVGTLIGTLVTLVKAGFADLLTAVTDYN